MESTQPTQVLDGGPPESDSNDATSNRTAGDATSIHTAGDAPRFARQSQCDCDLSDKELSDLFGEQPDQVAGPAATLIAERPAQGARGHAFAPS